MARESSVFMPADRDRTGPEPAPRFLGDDFRRALGLVVLIVAVFAAFLPALQNGFVLWDDDMNLVENLDYRGLSTAHLRWMFTTFHGGQYQPLTWLSFGLDYVLWEMNPAGYHLTSLLLHAANAVLAYRLIRVLLRRTLPDREALAAALAGALFFAIHPLRVESVAWATARRDVLSGFFYLVTLLAYVRMVDEKERGGPWWPWLGASLGCFVLSLLAKTWGVTLPLVLLAMDVYPLRRFAATSRSSRGGVLAEKAVFGLIAAGGIAVTLRMLHEFTDVKGLAEHGLVARAAQAAYGLWFYVSKTLVPLGLSPLYMIEPTLDPTRPRYVVCGLAVLAAGGALIALGRRWPWALAAVACYAIIVGPMLGFMQTGPQIAADRYTYLACLPWAFLLAAGLRRRPLLLPVAAVGLVLLGVLTWRQTRIWKDTQSLWNHALRVDPENYFAHLNLGWERQVHGDFDGAYSHYGEALRINPKFTFAYNNRGSLLQTRGQYEAAMADFAAAIEANPLYESPYLNRGTLRLARGDLDGAIADLSEAIRLVPSDGRPYNNRGLARREKNDVAGAAADFHEALARFPPGTPGRQMIEGNLADLEESAGKRAPD